MAYMIFHAMPQITVLTVYCQFFLWDFFILPLKCKVFFFQCMGIQGSLFFLSAAKYIDAANTLEEMERFFSRC